MELKTDGHGEAVLSPLRKSYGAGSMVSVYLYPEAGYSPTLTLNGAEVAPKGLLYTFAVTGDTSLTVGFVKSGTAAEPLPLFPEEYRGQWRATDGSFALDIGENSLTLTRWGALLPVELHAVYDPAFGGSEFFFADVLGKRYELTFFGSAAALSLKREGETIVFVPKELPSVAIPSSGYGKYVLSEDSPQRTERTLTLSKDGIFWGEEQGIPLQKFKLGGAESAMILFGEKVYAIFFCRTDELFEYSIVLRDPLTEEEYYYV